MGPRLVAPEVEKDFRRRSRGEREALSDGFPRSSRVLLRGSAAGVPAVEERLRVSGEADARGDDLERLEMRATEIEWLGSERSDLQARHAAPNAERA